MKKDFLSSHLLSKLGDQPYAVRQKAYILSWLSIILIPLLIVPTAINLTTAASTHPVFISVTNAMLIVGFIAGLLLLKRGRFTAAVSVINTFITIRVVVGVMGKMDTWLLTGSNNNLFFVFAALGFIAFFSSWRFQFLMAAVFIIMNVAVLTYAAWVDTPGFNLLMGSTINVIIAIIIVSAMSYLVASTAASALQERENELEKNIRLGRVLERQITELSEAHGELEAINAELTAKTAELTEANKNLMIFRNFAEESGQGLGMSTLDGIVIYANRALASLVGGKAIANLVGHHFIDCYPQEVKSKVLREIVPGVIRDSQWVGELSLKNPNGDTIPTIQNIFLMRDTEQKPMYLAIVVTDLTDRKQLEMKLLLAQKMEAIGRLTGGIAHDFNNILTAILGFSELLLRDLGVDDPRRAYAEEIKRAGRLSSDIVRQLLAFSRNQITRTLVFDLNVEIETMRKMLRRFIREDIDLVLDLDAAALTMRADPSQIGQIIINLVINASDAIPNKGRISIRTRLKEITLGDSKAKMPVPPGTYAMMSIEDDGVGIDADLIDHLFEPFYTTKEPEKGTGLGLSVVYGIVKSYGGVITVKSEKGRGTVFDVYLPVCGEEAVTDINVRTEEGLSGNGERILVVEDQEKVRSFAVTILKEQNYTVFEAGSAEEAIRIFEEEEGKFDLLFSDVVLPGMSGLDLLDTLRSRSGWLKVLLTTGYTEQKLQLDIIRERGYEILHKPYSMDELLSGIQGVLSKGN